MPRARRNQPTPVPIPEKEVVYVTPAEDELDKIIAARLQQMVNPTANLRRCPSCSRWTNSVQWVCPACVRSGHAPNPDSFFSRLMGHAPGTFIPDLVNHIFEADLDELEAVVENLSDQDAAQYLCDLWDAKTAEPANPMILDYPLFAKNNGQPYTGDPSDIHAYVQGAMIFRAPTEDEIVWIRRPRPESPRERQTRLSNDERRLVEARRRSQEAHIAALEELQRKTVEELQAAKQAPQI